MKNTLLTFAFLIFLNIQESIAKNIPTPKGSDGFKDDIVVGGSIDILIPFVLVIGVIVGIWAQQKQFKLSRIK